MTEQASARPARVGLFLNPAGQRRVDFQTACGELFTRLFLADGIEQASYLVARQPIDLLVVDLDRFERSIDLAGLCELLRLRQGQPTLLICPYSGVAWLPALMACGPLQYAIGPLDDAAMHAQIHAALAPAAGVPMVQTLDASGAIHDVNPAWLAALGYTREQVLGQFFGRFLMPEALDQAQSQLSRLKPERAIANVPLALLRADGGVLDALLSASVECDPYGAPLRTRCELRPRSEVGGALLELQLARESELRELLALQGRVQRALIQVDDIGKVAEQLCAELCTYPGVLHAALLHLKGMGDLQLEAQESNNGLDLAQLLGGSTRLLQSPLHHVFPGLLAAVSGEMSLLDLPEKAGDPGLAMSLHDKGVEMVLGVPIPVGSFGATRGALCLMFDRARCFSQQELNGFLALAQLAGFGLRMAEMSAESEQLLAKLTHLSTIDALTGTVNRRQGEELLEQEIRRARRYGVPLALISFDIDHFKAINDQFGHPVGDGALCAVTAITQTQLRTTDLLARIGGEEFLVIAPHTNAIDALRMAEKMRAAVAESEIAGCDRVTISLGVAQLGSEESGDALMQRLDAALARAKRCGRNCVELAMQ